MINKAILIGRVGKDPESKTTSNGASVTNFSVATTEKYKDKSGSKKETTTWHNCQAWRGLSEICAKYLKKGSLVYISGKISNRSYEKDGQTRYISEIIVNEMQMLDKKENDSRSGSGIPF